MNDLLRDLRYGFRALSRRPAFTGVVLLTLALVIGANSAIFSFVNAILLRPLPYREPERLMLLHTVRGGETGRVSLRDLRDVQEQLSVFEDIAAYAPNAQYNMSGDGPPEEAPATLCTHNLFSVLGVPFAQGGPWPADFDRLANYSVVLSDSLWRRRYGATSDFLTRKITLDGAPLYSIYGVLPPGIHFPFEAELFRSIAYYNLEVEERAARYYHALGRLKAGVGLEQARAELKSLGQRLAAEHPDTNASLGFELRPLSELYTGDARPYLLLLLGAVSFVLLIGCANVVNLWLSRALEREKEIAVRTALGAGRRRVVRQLLTESLLLGLLGGALGLGFSVWWAALLSDMVGVELPVWMKIHLDGRVLAYTLGISVVSGLAAGLVPALQASRPRLGELLQEEARGTAGSVRKSRLRGGLVVAELALAVTLLSGAGLMVQSFLRLQGTDLGFDPRQLLTFRVALGWKAYLEPERMNAYFEQVLERLRALPGVQSAAIDSNLPLSGEEESYRQSVTLEGQSLDEQQKNPYVDEHRVSPNYFDVMRIPLLRGRGFDERDTAEAGRVAIVGERLAARLWPGQEALGKQFKVGGPDSEAKPMTVIGIAGRVKRARLEDDAGLDLYVLMRQVPDLNAYFVVRTAVPPLSLSDAASRAALAVDPEQSTFNALSMEQRIGKKLWQRRVARSLFVGFAALAAVLSAIGIYGLMSYSVRQRTREMGVRAALGAQPHELRRLILGDTLRLALAGVGIGLLLSLALSRGLASLLYGVDPAHPATLLAACGLLLGIALLSGLVPAARASRVDPIHALRQE